MYAPDRAGFDDDRFPDIAYAELLRGYAQFGSLSLQSLRRLEDVLIRQDPRSV